eukprot:TRINITY_DN108835_c0_g1_i1.p1 TRINITY_DN108835_c0_g1~~TRINITY_DN108835_c0_g1_i1.p1  ORF type:complete len:105 (+),score=24.91 TRINITY_DN108835_c0_g1_i1:239-553(+)
MHLGMSSLMNKHSPFKDPSSLFSFTNKRGEITTFFEGVSGSSESNSSPSPAFTSSLQAVIDRRSASSPAAPHHHSVEPSNNAPFLHDGSMTQQEASAGCTQSAD